MKVMICRCAGSVRRGKGKEKEVIRIGFEPMTYSLEGCRSIQLSYRTSFESVYVKYDAKLTKFPEKGK
jgi:hypothetical protein